MKALTLHERGDCYVSLTHGEGWKLGAYEAAAAGNSVIITGYGGQGDFLPGNLAYRVDYDRVHDPFGGLSYTPNQQWAKPDRPHASRILRGVYDNRQEAADRGRQLAANVHEHFSNEAITKALHQALISTWHAWSEA